MELPTYCHECVFWNGDILKMTKKTTDVAQCRRKSCGHDESLASWPYTTSTMWCGEGSRVYLPKPERYHHGPAVKISNPPPAGEKE